MKNVLFFIFTFVIAIPVTAQTTFVHPGALDNKVDLDFVKTKIQTGEQPWTAAFNKVKVLATKGGNALTYINSKNEDANISKTEAQKAYANALVWYFTENEVYAQQTIDILNAWSSLQAFNSGTDQDKLQAGWIGALFAPAAEIMRTYSGWTRAVITRCQAMFKRAYYPQLNTASNWNGNVDLTQIDAMINMAIFNEDEAEFNLAIERFNKRLPSYFYQTSDSIVPPIDGDGNNTKAFWSNPTKWVNGITQETCRDNNHHAQYAMASALHIAEVAWHQGVDLYTPNTKRLTDTMELMAIQITSGSMQGTCTNNVTTTEVFDTWEIGYNHYHARKGISLPNTLKILTEKVRATGISDWNIFFETLTHGR